MGSEMCIRDRARNSPSSDYGILLTTCASEETKSAIIDTLLEQRLTPCIQVIPGIESHYVWQDKIVNDREFLLVIKTTAEYYEKVEQIIKDNHDYDIPEIIFLSLTKGSNEYLNWIDNNITSPISAND